MESRLFTAKSVQAAVAQAAEKLSMSSDQVKENLEILEAGKPGLFGLLGGRDATIRVSYQAKAAPAESDPLSSLGEEGQASQTSQPSSKVESADLDLDTPILDGLLDEVTDTEDDQDKEAMAKDFLETVSQYFDIDIDIETENLGEYTKMSMTGQGMGVLIGRRGETLDALQYLLNLAVHKQLGRKPHIILDAEGYRDKRKKTLEKLAQNLAKKAKRTQRPVVLEPMNPQERRIIHTSLQDHTEVYTSSEGKEPYRKVVIKLK